MSKPTWLPNLVGGVSIWKLATDLNQPNFFDGRLLVPETEGSDSLPSRVTWDLAGLVPLAEARQNSPIDVERAVSDFVVCLDRASKEFGDPASGYHKFKEALTFPVGLAAGTEGEDGSYFYDPKTQKVRAINWGATARTLAGQEVRVFSFVNWSALAKAAVVAAVVAAPAVALAAAEVPTEAPKDEEKKEEPKEEKKEEEKKKRPWWLWLLIGLFALALIGLLLWLLKACNEANVAALEAGVDSGADVDGALAADALGADALADANGADDATGDAAVDAKAHDGAADGGDGSLGDGSGGGGGGGGGGAGGGTGGGGGGGTGGGGGGGTGGTELPHRVHFHPDATEWRIVKGGDLVADKDPPDGKGDTFRVTLKRGSTFQNLAVEWKDKAGKWHTF